MSKFKKALSIFKTAVFTGLQVTGAIVTVAMVASGWINILSSKKSK